MLGYKKGNTKLLTGQIPLHYPADRVYLDGDTTKNVQDKVARKADLTNLDLTGTTNTTGSTISSGTYFYLNGVLVRAKQAIQNGGDFTLNTNYEVVTDGGLNNMCWNTHTEDNTNSSIGLPGNWNELLVYVKKGVGANIGTVAHFIKGKSKIVRSGYYSSATNYATTNVTYDSVTNTISTFFNDSGTIVTNYVDVYYKK